MKQICCTTSGNRADCLRAGRSRNPFSLKKLVLFAAAMACIPAAVTAVFGLFSSRVRLGGGDQFLRNRHMGKEIMVEQSGLYKSMDVEEFVAGVLPGTIPPDYERETLRLQAVLVRTNILKEMQEQNTSDAADLSYHYLTVEERKELWGERNYDKYEKRMEEAVAQTAGQVLKQGGELITAFYHEVSVGQTASAEEILGTEISYLQSVDSGRDVEAKHYMNLVTYTWQELRDRITRANGGAGEEHAAEDTAGDAAEDKAVDAAKDISGEMVAGKTADTAGDTAGDVSAGKTGGAVPEDTAGEMAAGTAADAAMGAAPVSIQIEESTEHGYVKKITIDGTQYSGTEAMELLGIGSTNFYVEETGEGVRIICLGRGSGLGVSQFGANCMAQEGRKLQEIVDYYYQGVSLAQVSP